MATAPRNELPAMFWTLVGLVVIAPLPFGSVDSWSWGLLSLLVGGLLLIWAGRVLLGWQTPAFGLKSAWPLLVPFLAVAAWAWLQTRAGLLPAAWDHPLWDLAGGALGWQLPATISVDPYHTGAALLRLLAYGGVFWLAYQLCARTSRARTALVWISYAAVVYAVYGLLMYFLGLDLILFFQKTAYLEDLTATFVNRNSFATYAGLGLICMTGLIMVLITQSAGSRGTVNTEGVLRIIETIAERGWPLILGWLALLLALLLSHSRAGLLSTLVGLGVFLAAAGLTRAVNRRLALAVGAVASALIVLFLALNGDALVRRLLTTSLGDEDRPVVYARVTEAVRDSGNLGTGYGTFEEIFRFYRTPEIQGTFTKAHNVYLENMLELGVPAAAILAAAVAVLFVLCAIGVRRRRQNAVYPCVGLAATVVVAVHSLVDFSLQIPAVAMTYAMIMGLACAQCRSSRRPDDPW
jgi:O-antigen ligase